MSHVKLFLGELQKLREMAGELKQKIERGELASARLGVRPVRVQQVATMMKVLLLTKEEKSRFRSSIRALRSLRLSDA
jgi:hypothetical protein